MPTVFLVDKSLSMARELPKLKGKSPLDRTVSVSNSFFPHPFVDLSTPLCEQSPKLHSLVDATAACFDHPKGCFDEDITSCTIVFICVRFGLWESVCSCPGRIFCHAPHKKAPFAIPVGRQACFKVPELCFEYRD